MADEPKEKHHYEEKPIHARPIDDDDDQDEDGPGGGDEDATWGTGGGQQGG